MKVCVTGGLGFIGRRLCAALAGTHSVVVVDSGQPPTRCFPGVTLCSADIRDSTALDRCFEGVDVVVHLAALHSVLRCERNPALAHDINVVGTAGVSDSSRRRDVRRLIFASSAAVYGDAHTSTDARLRDPRPAGAYGRSKLAAEHELRRAGEPALDTRILRLFNVYGPGQAQQRPLPAVPAALEAAFRGRPFIVRGSGEHVRDYVHVDDVIDVITAEVHSVEHLADPLDVGTAVGTSVVGLLDHVQQISGRPVRREQVTGDPGDILTSVAVPRVLNERHPQLARRSLPTGLAQMVSDRVSTGVVGSRVGSSV